MTPLVSVVIPSYNSARWITDTLASVRAQTCSPELVETIVVDDASSDGSADLARAYLARYGMPGRVITLARNGGVGAARNVGWRLARGAWIQFLDQDDLLAPHKIELQLRLAERAPADVSVIYSSWQHYALTDDTWQPSGEIYVPDVEGDALSGILQEYAFGYLGPTLMRRAAVALANGFEEQPNIGEDITLMMRLAMDGGRFMRAESEGPAFFYRETPGSLWRMSITRVVPMRSLIRAFRRAESFLRARDQGELSLGVRLALANRYTRHIEFFLEHDIATFNEIVEWVDGLQLEALPHAGRGTQVLVRLTGYERTLRMRRAVRGARRRVVGWVDGQERRAGVLVVGSLAAAPLSTAA